MMITFIDFLTIPEIIKLKILNSKTYNGNELTIFYKTNYNEILRYLRRLGHLENCSKASQRLRMNCWEINIKG